MQKKHYIFNELVEDEWGLIGFNLDLDEETSGIYSGEEIMAMILKHAKDLAETKSGSEIQDVVLTIPAGWDMNRRQMIVDSAELVGLRIM